MPYGYVIANIDITNPEQMAEYRKWSTEAVAAYGGEFIVRGGQQQVLEGTAHARTVVIRTARPVSGTPTPSPVFFIAQAIPE